jgi:hypothetical protein
VFIAIDAAALGSGEEIAHIADAIVADLRTRYPGRRALDARRSTRAMAFRLTMRMGLRQKLRQGLNRLGRTSVSRRAHHLCG